MFKENYIIKGNIFCETGLHIGGSSDNIDIGGTDNEIIRDTVSDLPFIPGSSLKGKLRSLMELHDADSMLSVLNNKGKVSTDENCKAAKIFGLSADEDRELKYPTRIIVRDSFPTEESVKLWEENDDIVRGTELKYENTINRLSSAANPRNMERVPKGSSFNFEIIFSVYDEDDDNVLGVFEAMSLLEDNYLGGGGSRGFGKIRFTNITIIKRTLTYYTEDASETVLVEDANIPEAIENIK
jgi:CRISPR-associated protein Csm3